MISLEGCRRLFTSSLEAYTILASEARCRRVERMGEAVGLQILMTVVLAHLECEEEKAKHRMAGDKNLDVIREILEGQCSADLLKRECQKLFSYIDKVLLTQDFLDSLACVVEFSQSLFFLACFSLKLHHMIMQAERAKIGFHEVREALTHLKIYLSLEQVSGLCCQLQPEDSIGSDVWEQLVMKNYQEIYYCFDV
jgi:hypothetical protein